MSELNKSLTAIDWLPKMNAKGALNIGMGSETLVLEENLTPEADSSTPSSPPANTKPPYR